jgi:hypothetical protein
VRAWSCGPASCSLRPSSLAGIKSLLFLFALRSSVLSVLVCQCCARLLELWPESWPASACLHSCRCYGPVPRGPAVVQPSCTSGRDMLRLLELPPAVRAGVRVCWSCGQLCGGASAGAATGGASRLLQLEDAGARVGADMHGIKFLDRNVLHLLISLCHCACCGQHSEHTDVLVTAGPCRSGL